MTKLLWLLLAGGIGSVLRWGIAEWVQRVAGGGGFPWGTLAVNAAGCFLFGLIFALTERRLMLGPETRLIVLTGFMGAFTTFSTYAFESSALIRDGQWPLAIANLGAQNGVGIAFAVLGLVLGERI
ncbi:MAG: fluoride efflux transporter CrcB [Phycisphaeraceae bacterium]